MKKVEAIVKPFTVDGIKEELGKIGVHGLTAYEVKGFGKTKGRTELYQGTNYKVDFLPKLKLEILIHDDQLDSVIDGLISKGANR